MTTLNPSMRLKVRRDTFFLPDPNGSVYFRNNEGSFRMEGKTIQQWIEQLLPAFDGEHTLADLTDGLPDKYRDRVYEIAEVLYRNGFVRDVSQDRQHQLPEDILKHFGQQIAFLDNFGDSGARRFQSYRESKVLAVGSGHILASLVTALFESGLPKVHVLVTNPTITNQERLWEIASHARMSDSAASLEEITMRAHGNDAWRETIKPYDGVMYVSQEEDVEDLRALHAVCRQEKKVLIPAMYVQQVGMAGPLVHPDLEGSWESALRRIHRSAVCNDPKLHNVSSPASAILANVIAFELFKTITGAVDSGLKNQFFLLNLETLEGNWHSFLPHPLVDGCPAPEWLRDCHLQPNQQLDGSDFNRLLPFFGRLTSTESGIFDVWEEGDLKQLPLAMCRIQAVDPLSEGPAELLRQAVCCGVTHEEARREAGLTGIEHYVSRMASRLLMTLPPHPDDERMTVNPQEYVGVGAGETVAEGVIRGLQKCLTEELGKQLAGENPSLTPVQLRAVEDGHCRFYLQSLTTVQGTPTIGLGQQMCGFPVMWVGAGGRWYSGIGLNVTLALRHALQRALLTVLDPAENRASQPLNVEAVVREQGNGQSLVIPPFDEAKHHENLHSGLQVLGRNGKRLFACNLAVEPFLKEGIAGVLGVVLREEEPQ